MYQQQGSPEDHTLTLKVIPGFTPFPISTESTAKVKLPSNVQRCDIAPLFLLVNSDRLIVPGHTPNVHLIPYSNSIDKKKSIPQTCLLCYTVPWTIQPPPFVQSLTFQVPQCPLSRVTHPLARFPRIRRSNIQSIYLPQNYHIGHNILMEINGHYWVPVSHNGPTPEVLYQHTVACSNLFCCCCQFL